jgi:hypothetical protein
MATDRNHAFTVGSFDILHTLQEEIKDESCGGIYIEYILWLICEYFDAYCVLYVVMFVEVKSNINIALDLSLEKWKSVIFESKEKCS